MKILSQIIRNRCYPCDSCSSLESHLGATVGIDIANLNFNHLYYFHRIAEAGSLSQASRDLGLAQSTVSEQLRQLEEQFAAQLFHREPSGLKLNDAGRRMYRFTKIMFRTGQRLLHAFSGEDPDEKVVIDVGVASAVSRAFAADYFVTLFEDPEVLVRFRHGDHNYLQKDLVTYQLDLMLSDQKPDLQGSGLVSEVIDSSSLVLVHATASDTIAERFNSRAERFPFLHYTVNSRYRWEVDQLMHRTGLGMDIIGEVDDVLIMRSAVEQGICAAVLPEPVIRDDLATNRFTAVESTSPLNAAVYASYHKRDPSELVLSMIERLRSSSKIRGVESS